MAESPKRPTDVSRAEASRLAKPAKPAAPTNDTARAADSVPVAVGPFTVLPTKFGRYRIDKLLGKGAMGAVYLAHDTQLDRSVALKVARVSAAGSAKLIQRMETEAKAAAKLDHPQICKVYDFGEIDGIRFIALQYIEGEDLKSYLKRVGRKREPAEAIGLILQIARALEAAHAKDVIHRDLKPENIMLNQKSEPVIMDFGLARRMSGANNAGLTQGMILGTAAYMSPEQAIGKAEGIDHRTDLYALGVMLFEMLVGEWPFTGSAIEVMGRKTVQEAPSPQTVDPNVSPQLAVVCHKLIARKKEDRYATCAELVAALEAVDLKAPVALEMDVEFRSFELPAPPKWLKQGKAGVLSHGFSGIVRRIKPIGIWWQSQTWAMRGMLLGCGAILAVMFSMLFFSTSSGVVQIDIDDPTLSVCLDGNVITADNGGRQIPVTSMKKRTLEVLLQGKVIESATTELMLKKGEKSQRVKVSLKNGQMIVVEGQTTTRAGVLSDIPPRTSLLPEMSSKATGMRLSLIPAGTFQMGSPTSEVGRSSDDEGPQHTVRITKPFYLGVFEVTQSEYQQITGMRPSWFCSKGKGSAAVAGQDTSRFPVEQTSWFDALEFCNWLSERDGRPAYYQLTSISRTDGSIEKANVTVSGGIGYRLPTEAEWEYACRARTTTPFSFGSEANGEQANRDGRYPYGTSIKGPFLNRSTTVGSYSKNGFGLFDMHGNVGEWCVDRYSSGSYSSRTGTTDDPLVTDGAEPRMRVWRGGWWNSTRESDRSAYRVFNHPSVCRYSLGLRVACSAPDIPAAANK